MSDNEMGTSEHLWTVMTKKAAANRQKVIEALSAGVWPPLNLSPEAFVEVHPGRFTLASHINADDLLRIATDCGEEAVRPGLDAALATFQTKGA